MNRITCRIITLTIVIMIIMAIVPAMAAEENGGIICIAAGYPVTYDGGASVTIINCDTEAEKTIVLSDENGWIVDVSVEAGTYRIVAEPTTDDPDDVCYYLENPFEVGKNEVFGITFVVGNIDDLLFISGFTNSGSNGKDGRPRFYGEMTEEQADEIRRQLRGEAEEAILEYEEENNEEHTEETVTGPETEMEDPVTSRDEGIQEEKPEENDGKAFPIISVVVAAAILVTAIVIFLKMREEE